MENGSRPPNPRKEFSMRTLPCSLAALLLCGAVSAQAADPKLETDDQKTVYAIGVALAQSLQPYYLKPEEVELVKMGLTDGLADKSKVDLKEYRVKLQQLGQDR